jgi:antitoxin component YwqK of YwqJK toxin-antitoxin module
MESQIKNGLHETYYEDGIQLKEKCYYIDDVLDGSYISYHPNGQKDIVTNYKNGKCHGQYKRFDDDGRLIVSKYYNYGNLILNHQLYQRD